MQGVSVMYFFLLFNIKLVRVGWGRQFTLIKLWSPDV